MLGRQLIKLFGYSIIRLSEIGTSKPNLVGDRYLEWSWVSAHLPDNPGAVLDFGCGEAFPGLVAAMRGGHVVGLDRKPVRLAYQAHNLRIQSGDILRFDLGESRFDIIINCSSVEHVGLAGRYGSTHLLDGDLIAMERLRNLLRIEGFMILTIPVGQDAIFAPLHRVYGQRRLGLLLKGFRIIENEFWSKKAPLNSWFRVSEEEALAVQPSRSFYALGFFILKSGL